MRQLNRACQRGVPRPRRASCGRGAARPTGWSPTAACLLRLPFRGPLDWDSDGCLLRRPGDPRRRARRQGARTDARSSSTATPACSSCRPAATTTWCCVAHLPHWEELIHVVSPRPPHRQPRPRPRRAGRPARRRPDRSGRSLASPARPTGRRDLGSVRDRRAGDHRPAGDPRRCRTRSPGGSSSGSGRPVPGLGQIGLTHTFPSRQTSRRRRPRRSRAHAGSRRARFALSPAPSPTTAIRLDRSVEPRRAHRLRHRDRRPRPMDRALSRASARRARRLPDHRPRPSARSSATCPSFGRRARRPRRTMATVAGTRGDAPLDGQRLAISGGLAAHSP